MGRKESTKIAIEIVTLFLHEGNVTDHYANHVLDLINEETLANGNSNKIVQGLVNLCTFTLATMIASMEDYDPQFPFNTDKALEILQYIAGRVEAEEENFGVEE